MAFHKEADIAVIDFLGCNKRTVVVMNVLVCLVICALILSSSIECTGLLRLAFGPVGLTSPQSRGHFFLTTETGPGFH